jgi:hypothetical protein
MDWEISHLENFPSSIEINQSFKNDISICFILKSEFPDCLVDIISEYSSLFPKGPQISGVDGGLFDRNTLPFLLAWVGWYENLLPLPSGSRSLIKYPEPIETNNLDELPNYFLKYPVLKSTISLRYTMKLIWDHFGGRGNMLSENVNLFLPPISMLMTIARFFVPKEKNKQPLLILYKNFKQEEDLEQEEDLVLRTLDKKIQFQIGMDKFDPISVTFFSSIFESSTLQTRYAFRSLCEKSNYENKSRTNPQFQEIQKQVCKKFLRLGIHIISDPPLVTVPKCSFLFPSAYIDSLITSFT